MTDIDITPEILRAAADWIDGCGHGLGPGHALREEAGRLEREQADEKRIDEYARAYWAAQRETQNLPHDYDKIPGGLLAAHRAGIRAVLAKLNEEKAAEEPQNACESELTEIERMIAEVKDRAQKEPDFPKFRRLTAKLAELENRRREILGGAL